MKILVWDTSSKAGALGALEWDQEQGLKLIAEWSLNVNAQHSERLLWAIHQLLESCRWKLEDVDLFGVGVGPGSFTGLRIGITTARTLSHTLKKPLIGVSSLAALARPAAMAQIAANPSGKTLVIAATDACKGELFALWGMAKAVVDCVIAPEEKQAGLWKRGVEEQVSSPEFLMKSLKKKLGPKDQWLVVGEGRARYEEAWKLLPKAREIQAGSLFSDQVQGRYLGQLVWEAYQAGKAKDGLDIHPRYLRASDAELKLRAGLLKRAPE